MTLEGKELKSLSFKWRKLYFSGWGLRCLDDIPKGGFICIYAGQLLTDQGANEDGQQYGDEYLAELDYIEVNRVLSLTWLYWGKLST